MGDIIRVTQDAHKAADEAKMLAIGLAAELKESLRTVNNRMDIFEKDLERLKKVCSGGKDDSADVVAAEEAV